MNKQELLELLAEGEALLADGFEEAFIEVCRRFGQPSIALYDIGKCLEILVQRDGATLEEAIEHFEFNVIGAWAGDGTPAFALLTGDRDAQNFQQMVGRRGCKAPKHRQKDRG